MNRRFWIAATLVTLLTAGVIQAQQVDASFGVGTILAPSAANASGNYSSQSLRGGAYPVIRGDFLLHKNYGIMGEVSWRASQNNYQGTSPYRPLFWDFNGIYAPRLGDKAGLELSAGIGAESIRFYQPFYYCSFYSCTNYTSSNHFMGHFGGGLRYYFHGGAFIRPEADFYLIRNNYEFSSPYAVRLAHPSAIRLAEDNF
ncbi:MAG TPA: hypothetical protein VKW78_17300 [Terriglobales bacterium]|nr:hypothetical protein [Terriglobales bacterium]